MGGFEGADHVNGEGHALDLVRDSGHLARLDEDHAAVAALGLRSVRESIGWRLSEPRPGEYDLSRAVLIAESARRHGIQVLWTLMHYGTPADLSLWDDGVEPGLDDPLVTRFARFAAAVAARLAPLHDRPPVYTLINEVGFLSWLATSTTQVANGRRAIDGDEGRTDESGYALKCRLVRAVLAGIDAVRKVDPRARFLHVEPVVHVVAPRGRPDLSALAERVDGYQWQVWDLLSGRCEPQLGGHLDALDLIGVNHYHSGQWEVQTERRLVWHTADPRRRPFADQLASVWRRYGRPLIVAETGHVGAGRAAWLHGVAHEVRCARHRGVPVQGLCLYPLIDRPDWNLPARWHRSGLWDVLDPATLARHPCADYLAALATWQGQLPFPNPQGSPMPALVVFSHLRWSFVWQRPQHLMSQLARHHRVVFIEEPVHDPDGEARLVCIPRGPHLQVLVPHTPVPAAGFHDDQLPVLRPLIEQWLRHEGLAECIVWFYTPMALPLATSLRPSMVIYDCMDELAAFKDAPRQLRQRETALMKLADLVLTGGPSLYEARRSLHPQLHCLPSAVDAAHFAPPQAGDDSLAAVEAAALQTDLPRPRLGYFGVIDERLDLGLIEHLAATRPDWQFVFAGPIAKIDPAALPQGPNLHWLGLQAYERLPHLMAGWDVCLMPFALNDATRHISPTKTLEYLAGQKPVVSTAVPDVVSLYGDLVAVARDAEAFLRACESALAESPAGRARRVERAAPMVLRSSWARHGQRIASLIETHLRATAPASPASTSSPTPGRTLTPAAVAEPRPAAGDPLRAPAPRTAARNVPRLIIGAGPTGLAAALALGEGAHRSDTLVVERERQVGGYCRSLQQEGYTFDQAGHIMFSQDPDVLALYERLLGDNLHWQDREAWVWSHGVYTRYPFQGSLYGLPPRVLKDCIVGAIEARYGSLDGSAPAPAAPPANFAEFIERVWGRGIGEHFALPYNRKLWATPLEEIETSWLGGRVPLPDLAQIIEGALEPSPPPMGPNARFGYPLRGGFQALMDGFLPLLNCELDLGCGVLEVHPEQHSVRLDDGRLIRYDTLLSTMPLPRLVEACGDAAPAAVRAAAAALRHVAVRCVNLGVELAPGQTRLTDKHWVYYPGDTVFHRIFVQGNASPHNNPPGGFGLTCEISHAPSKPLPCDGAALIERCIADARAVGMIGPAQRVQVANQVDMPCAYVVYDHARSAHVAIIRRWLDGHDIVLAGRYAEWEYYNSDHAFVAGRRAAQAVRHRAGPVERAGAAR